MNASLDVLTDLQRETIQLSYFDGMTYHEIAIQLSVPVNTIKTRRPSQWARQHAGTRSGQTAPRELTLLVLRFEVLRLMQ